MERPTNSLEEEEPTRIPCCLLELPLGEAASTFHFEKAVCSHGLFIMAPNFWDPLSKTLSRPLTLDDDNNVMVRISHPSHTPHSLHVHVYASHSLSPHQKQSLLGQVVRMMRLSESDERNVRGYRKIVASIEEEEEEEEEEERECLRSFSGRVFRSPTLFEDMVKCILLCNCQWSRTLSMAKALCELQLELQHHSSTVSVSEAGSVNSRGLRAETEKFIPKTPAGKDSKRKLRVFKVSKKLTTKFSETKAELEACVNLKGDCDKTTTLNLSPSFLQNNVENDFKPCPASTDLSTANLHSVSDIQFSEVREPYAYDRIGNFPSPRELANLDETFLAKHCNLGYRASRILKLAQGIVEGRIQLRQLEEVCKEANLSSYDKLAKQLSEIYGFGPFTCANVLMCMGFYHVIPTDCETIRHLNQVHARNSTIQTVNTDVERIYGKFAPYQFLAYWAELWHFYEQRFGKFSAMPHSDYKLITASNMRTKGSRKNKRTKTS